jgi:hypothetical protein
MVKDCVVSIATMAMRSVAKNRFILLVGVWRRLEKVEIALGRRRVEMYYYWFLQGLFAARRFTFD